MASPTCSLSILVARTDVSFMTHTIPHLVRSCNFPFQKRVLFVDTAPLTGDKVLRPGIGSLENLRACCKQLLDNGTIDEVIDINYSEQYRLQVYQKHFNSKVRQTHNYKGYPILGTIFSLEQVPGEYILHFDSDMLLYQSSYFNWIETGINLIQSNPEICFIRPRCGPPAQTKDMLDHATELNHSFPFQSHQFFSSRAYLFERKRFESILPIPIMWRSYKHKFLNIMPTSAKNWLNYQTGKGQLASWEVMVTERIKHTSHVRANLTSSQAWTLHPKERGAEFIRALPRIIKLIEDGWYPDEQAGYYDMNWEAWQKALINQS